MFTVGDTIIRTEFIRSARFTKVSVKGREIPIMFINGVHEFRGILAKRSIQQLKHCGYYNKERFDNVMTKYDDVIKEEVRDDDYMPFSVQALLATDPE